MANSAKQRQAEYRAKRKAQGLCAYPGYDRKPRKYSLCPDHREDAKEKARDRTFMAAMYEDMVADRDRWRARATEIDTAGRSYRDVNEEKRRTPVESVESGNGPSRSQSAKSGVLAGGHNRDNTVAAGSTYSCGYSGLRSPRFLGGRQNMAIKNQVGKPVVWWPISAIIGRCNCGRKG